MHLEPLGGIEQRHFHILRRHGEAGAQEAPESHAQFGFHALPKPLILLNQLHKAPHHLIALIL